MTAKTRKYSKRDGLRLRGKVWYVVVRRGGRTEGVRGGAKDDALAKRDELRVASRKGGGVNASQFTFKNLLALLPSEPSKALREAWPETLLARDITVGRVRAFEAARLGAGKSRSTVNADLAALRHA